MKIEKVYDGNDDNSNDKNGHILKERAPLCLKGRQDVHFVDQKTVNYIVYSK